MEDVTSHHNVVRSSRIKQTLQVGARGLMRPDEDSMSGGESCEYYYRILVGDE